MDLWSSSVSTEPRYTLSVVDLHKRKGKNGPFAIFIVPQGRETEWLFSSDPGRKQLAESAGFERLVIVTLHRGHTYSSLDSVKEEVATKAVELVQQGLPHGKQYPVLTLGDGLGLRVVLYEGSSTHSGDYVVEECDGSEGGEGVRVRRLVFLSSQHLAQTEVHLVPAKTSKPTKKSKKKQHTHHISTSFDHTNLTFGHHQAIIASLALLPCLQKRSVSTSSLPSGRPEPSKEEKGEACKGAFCETGGDGRRMDLLLIGLGGGALPMFVNQCIPNCSVEVVELDEEVLAVAERWFGFSRGERMTIHIANGVSFINQCVSANKHGLYDVIVLDVDSKDISAGVSSPPLAFVEKQFLRNSKILLKDCGLFVTNMAARNKEKRTEILRCLSDTFPNLLSIPIPEDINKVIVSVPSTTILKNYGQEGSNCDARFELDLCFSQEVKKELISLTTTISENSVSRVNAEDLLKQWTGLLGEAKVVEIK